MFRQVKRLRNREDRPLAGTMLTAVLFLTGGLRSFARVQSAELSVEVRVSPLGQRTRLCESRWNLRQKSPGGNPQSRPSQVASSSH